MSQLPAYHEGENIDYDVPYVFMEDGNDCWKASLQMLYNFDVRKIDTSGMTDSTSKFGVSTSNIDSFLAKYLKPQKGDFTTGRNIYTLLAKSGPALVVLTEQKDILHAQILTGRRDANVFLNNPDNNFATAEMGASGQFTLIEQSFVNRYGGTTYDSWLKSNAATANPSTGPAAASNRPQNTSPPRSRSGSQDSIEFAEVQIGGPGLAPPSRSPAGGSPPGSRPGSPALVYEGSFADRSPPGSAPGSPASRSRSSSLGDEQPPSLGPRRESLDLTAVRLEFERLNPNTDAVQKRKYIEEMEKQLQFRKHRVMSIDTFKAKLATGFTSVWTLKDW